MHPDLQYEHHAPTGSLAYWLDSYWLLHNRSTTAREAIILPDGRVDLFLSIAPDEPFHISLQGISSHAEKVSLKAGLRILAISLKLPAAALLFPDLIAGLHNSALSLPPDTWAFVPEDMGNFEAFCGKSDKLLQELLPAIETDERKLLLFSHLYTSEGALSVKTLSEQCFWSSRQINRYFRSHFGLNLKNYCDILRFRASFPHIKAGKLYPEQDFADQSHFIKAVKKLSGALPKELRQNQNDRFIQFSTLPEK